MKLAREWKRVSFSPRMLQTALVAAGVLLFGSYVVCSAAVAAQDSQQPDSYYKSKVQPILKENCYKCHGFIHRGGLRLTSQEEILRGGKHGPAVIPGHPEDSLIIKYVTSDIKGRHMPPKGKLPADDIAVLEQWVRDGAKN